MIALFRQMFNAEYWMLDIQECADGEIQIIEYPETSIQDQP